MQGGSNQIPRMSVVEVGCELCGYVVFTLPPKSVFASFLILSNRLLIKFESLGTNYVSLHHYGKDSGMERRLALATVFLTFLWIQLHSQLVGGTELIK